MRALICLTLSSTGVAGSAAIAIPCPDLIRWGFAHTGFLLILCVCDVRQSGLDSVRLALIALLARALNDLQGSASLDLPHLGALAYIALALAMAFCVVHWHATVEHDIQPCAIENRLLQR